MEPKAPAEAAEAADAPRVEHAEPERPGVAEQAPEPPAAASPRAEPAAAEATPSEAAPVEAASPEPVAAEPERSRTQARPADSGSQPHNYFPPVAPPPSADPDPERRGGVSKTVKTAAAPAAADGVGRLNPRYNFDTFVIGSSNRFAHAAAFAVAAATARQRRISFRWANLWLVRLFKNGVDVSRETSGP